MIRVCTIFAIILCAHFISGCSSSNYVYHSAHPQPSSEINFAEESSSDNARVNDGGGESKSNIVVGKPNKVLDAADWVWPGSLFAKLLFWNKNIDSHQVSEKTLHYMAGYMEKNNLDDVQVLVNAYKPLNQWKRLVKNKSVGAGWRYTLGVASALAYTFIPGRIVGGDAYNPYTNTIYLYSDDFAVALHEAGHAKDWAGRTRKGSHAALYTLVPGSPLYYEARASHDALSYLHAEDMKEEEKHAYKTLHAAYSTYVGGIFLRQTGLSFLGVIPGHITGAIAASRVHDEKPMYDTVKTFANCTLKAKACESEKDSKHELAHEVSPKTKAGDLNAATTPSVTISMAE